MGERPRGARVEQDQQGGHRAGPGLGERLRPRDDEVLVAKSHGTLARRRLDFEVSVRHPVGAAHLDHPLLHGAAAQARRRARFLGSHQGPDVQMAELRQTHQGHDIGLIGPDEFLRVGEDELLLPVRRNRKDPGREPVSGFEGWERAGSGSASSRNEGAAGAGEGSFGRSGTVGPPGVGLGSAVHAPTKRAASASEERASAPPLGSLNAR